MLTQQDIVEIQQLMAFYGHAADADDHESLSEVFVEDAVFDARPVEAGLHRGLPAIRAWFARGKPPHPPSHNVTNVYVYEEAEEVRVKSKWLTINAKTGQSRAGDYDDVLVRTDAGWRISTRLATGRHVQPRTSLG